MTEAVLGKVIKTIRTHLSYSQEEFCKLINTKQTLLSRLETGKGASLEMVLSIINVLNEKGYRAHMIFSEPFNLEHIKPSQKSIEVEQVVEIVKMMKEDQSNYSNQLLTLLENINSKNG